MRFCLSVITILFWSASFAQPGYKIDFKIKGLKDTTIYLAFFLQENTYIKDTASVRNNAFTFNGQKTLPQGVYFLYLNKTNILQFVIGRQQHFSIETSTENYTHNVIVKGDDDNRLYFENLQFENTQHQHAEPFVKVLQDSTLTEAQKKDAREGFSRISKKVMDYQKSIIDKYPNTATARILNMRRPVIIPEPPRKANGNIDSSFQFQYYRKHYFDNYDLGDEVMLRVPKMLYWDMVKGYLTKLIVQHPDSITNAINKLAGIAKKNQETYKYFVWKCVTHYQQAEIMGLDEVYVNLVDRYFSTGEMDYWLDKKTIGNLKTYADKVRLAMIGTPAPNLIMQNEDAQPRALHDIKSKYTILYIFRTTCGHCREETPKLVNFYNANKKRFDFEVYAVAEDTSLQVIRKFVEEMKTTWITVSGPRSYIKPHYTQLYFVESTPTIYIIDEKKKVIARKLRVSQVEEFLVNYEKRLMLPGKT